MRNFIPSLLILIWLGIGSIGIRAQDNPVEETLSITGVRLSWTAPGDDNRYGRAREYDLRYLTYYINESNWSSAIKIPSLPIPGPAGCMEHFFVEGLPEGRRYFFAIKTVDDAGNWSLLSNVASKYAEDAICGDANCDGIVNVGDELHIRNYVFEGGPAPMPLEAGDCNCDGNVNLADAIYLFNYIFRSGSPVPCGACPLSR